MSKERLIGLKIIALCVFLLGISLGVTGCTSSSSAANSLTPMPDDTLSSPIPITQHSIPTPNGVTPVLLPTQPAQVIGRQEVRGLFVTPLPDEKIQVGMVSQIATLPTNDFQQTQYTIRAEIPPRQTYEERPEQIEVKKLFLQDIQSGQEIHLGDDNGHTLLEARSNRYIIWRYQRHGFSDAITLKTGLYAFDLETGEDIVIAQEPSYPVDPVISGQWVLYTDPEIGRSNFANLRVHNLVTGEDLLIGNNVPYNQDFNNRPSSDYYAISDESIVWVDVETGEIQATWMIRVYDLANGTTRALEVPNTISPEALSISGGIVVWWDRFWRGYDLQQDAVFTIPVIPPGWGNVPVQPGGPVTIKDNNLYWSLKVDDQVYHFTAPVIRNN